MMVKKGNIRLLCMMKSFRLCIDMSRYNAVTSAVRLEEFCDTMDK